MTALAEETGSLLVFLPGQGEIRRVEEALRERLPGRPHIHLAPLYGALKPEQQDEGHRARRRPASARSCWPPRSPRPA